MNVSQKRTANDQAETSGAPVISRLMWIFVGPLTLALLLGGIASGGGGWLTGIDVTYFVVFVLMILARWKEHRSGFAMTVYGDPVTPEHVRRYLLVAVPLGIAAWVVANLIGNRT
jgi:hypothetical protein